MRPSPKGRPEPEIRLELSRLRYHAKRQRAARPTGFRPPEYARRTVHPIIVKAFHPPQCQAGATDQVASIPISFMEAPEVSWSCPLVAGHAATMQPAMPTASMRSSDLLLLLLLAGAFLLSAASRATANGNYLGFNVSNAVVPLEDIRTGGPPRDGIPSIDRPSFIDPRRAGFLRPDDLVVSVTVDGETKAYPLRILVWHEIVNDSIASRPIAVTYCPLCGTAMVFDRRQGERVMTFGVSGLLYQSDMLMYDRETESLWSQLGTRSIAGPLVDQKLAWVASEHMTWKAWRDLYPHSRVLSTNTGHKRDYARSPYPGYEEHDRVHFPVPDRRRELPRKEWVVGIVLKEVASAYPIRVLEQNPTLEDTVAGVKLQVHYDAASQSVRVVETDSTESIPFVKAYWFAWQAFYPETRLHLMP